MMNEIILESSKSHAFGSSKFLERPFEKRSMYEDKQEG
jgi:hypothetical protein